MRGGADDTGAAYGRSDPCDRVEGPAFTEWALKSTPMARLRRQSSQASLAGAASAAAAEVEAHVVAPPDPTAAAFFDVDNTFLQGASLFHLARGLYERKLLTSRDIVGFAWQQTRFRIHGVEDPAIMAEARESALSFIAGRSVAELTAIGEEVFEEVVRSKVWPGTRALAQMHLDAGQRVWLV